MRGERREEGEWGEWGEWGVAWRGVGRGERRGGEGRRGRRREKEGGGHRGIHDGRQEIYTFQLKRETLSCLFKRMAVSGDHGQAHAKPAFRCEVEVQTHTPQ